MTKIKKEEIIEAKAINEDIQSVSKSLSGLLLKIKEIASSGGIARTDDKSLAEIAKLTELVNKVTEDLTKTKKELYEVEKKLSKIMAENAKAKAPTINKEAERQAKIAAAEARRSNLEEQKHQRLLLAVEAAGTNQKAKMVAQNKLYRYEISKLNPLIKEQAANISRLNQQIIENNTNITKLSGGTMSKLKNAVIGMVAQYLTIQSAITILKSFFDELRRLDALQFTMKAVIKDQGELAQTNIFLAQTASRYGLSLLDVSERYVKFRSAAIQSNLTARETQKIFNSVSQAAGVLALKTDEVQGVFLALEQMLSKGKVTTEELRRQLGERIPGAMGMMADALGVTLPKLDQMLKAGTILSSEALPKLAEQMEKTFSLDASKNVDTLNASIARLGNSWTLFVKSQQESTGFFKAMSDIGTQILNAMALFSSSNIETRLQVYANSSERIANSMKEILNLQLSQNTQKDLAVIRDIVTNKMFPEAQIGFDLEKYVTYFHDLLSAQKSLSSVSPFDLEGFKAQLSGAEEVLDNYDTRKSIFHEKEMKEYEETNAAVLKSGKTFQDYLNLKFGTYRVELAKSIKLLEEFDKANPLNEKGVRTPDQQAVRSRMSENISKYKEALQLIEEARMPKDSKSGTNKDDALKLQLEADKAELERLKRTQSEFLQAWIKSANFGKGIKERTKEEEIKYNNDIKTIESEFTNDQYELQMIQSKRIINTIKLTKEQELGFITEIEAKKADAAENDKKFTEADIKNLQDRTQAYLDRVEDIKKATEELRKARYENDINVENPLQISKDALTMQKNITKSGRQMRKAGMSEDEIAEVKMAKMTDVNNWANGKIIESNLERTNRELLNLNIEGEARAELTAKQKQLQEDYNKWLLAKNADVRQKEREQLQELFQMGGQLANESFGLLSAIYDARLDRAERVAEIEMQAAGDSVTAQITAQRKLDAEKRKLARKQANIDRAQSLFQIGLATAEGIIKWASVVPYGWALAAAFGAMGAVQTANVLSKPIPAYADGADSDTHDGGLALMGEEGIEMVKEPGKKPYLVSKGVYDIPKGTEVIPHDETQKLLANFAVKQNRELVDFSKTNDYLRSINNSLKNGETMQILGEYKYIKRGSITTKIKI